MPFTRPIKTKISGNIIGAFRNVLDTEFPLLGRICLHARPDRSSEYTAADFLEFCAECGIRVTYAATDTPSHNGLAERSHHTSIEMTRALLNQAGLGPEHWAEAIVHADLLISMLPTAGLPDGMTPFEAWTGQKSRIADLHVFGSPVFYYAPGGKFGKVAKCGLYFGPDRPTVGGAACIFCPETKRITVTRDFKVLEPAITADSRACQPDSNFGRHSASQSRAGAS